MTPRFDYQDDPAALEAFFRFTDTVFPRAPFRAWHATGGWDRRYRAASIFDGSRVVANASISHLELLVRGETVRAAQFATVGTLPERRREGLARRVLDAWLEELCDVPLLFLYANERVLDFYPRFGFRRVAEHVFRARVDWPPAERAPRAVAWGDAADRPAIARLLAERRPVTAVSGCADYAFALQFHLLAGHDRHARWLEEPEVLVVAEHRGAELHVYDVVSREPVSAREVLPRVALAPVREVVFHFTPDAMDLETAPAPDASPFFVRGAFPLEGTPFKLPELAQT